MLDEKKMELLGYYKQGLILYKTCKFSEAMEYFSKVLSIDPKDGPSRIYLERCQEYIENPPPDDWNGVFVMKTK